MLVVCLIYNHKMYFCIQIMHINLIKLQVSLVDEGTSRQSEDCLASLERPEALAEEYM